MYKYFVSFVFNNANGKNAFGNVVMESNVKITDYDSLDDMNNWILEMTKWIKDKINSEQVAIMNFLLLE